MIKVIIFSVLTTIFTISSALALFLNSILSLFGLVSTSIESFNRLQESKQVLEMVKSKYQVKKSNYKSKFIKRASAKVSSTASSAIPVVGTIGAMVAIASLEITFYCNDKKELQEEENLLYGTQIDFDYQKCLAEARDDSEEIITSIKYSAEGSLENAWKVSKDFTNQSWQKTMQFGNEVWSSTLNVGESLWELKTQ